MQSGVDIQCYNYTLTKPFDCAPSVAIGSPSFIQESMISRVSPATTSSFRSRPWTQTTTESSPSSPGPNGAIPGGWRFPSPSLPKHPTESSPVIIRSILRPCQLVSPASKSSLSFQPTARETTGKPLPTSMDSKSAPLTPETPSTLPSKCKSLSTQSTPRVSLFWCPPLRPHKFTLFSLAMSLSTLASPAFRVLTWSTTSMSEWLLTLKSYQSTAVAVPLPSTESMDSSSETPELLSPSTLTTIQVLTVSLPNQDLASFTSQSVDFTSWMDPVATALAIPSTITTPALLAAPLHPIMMVSPVSPALLGRPGTELNVWLFPLPRPPLPQLTPPTPLIPPTQSPSPAPLVLTGTHNNFDAFLAWMVVLAALIATLAAPAVLDTSSGQDHPFAMKSVVMDVDSCLHVMMAILLMAMVAAALAKSRLDLSALADLPPQETPAPEDYPPPSSSPQVGNLTFGARSSSTSGQTSSLRPCWTQQSTARTDATMCFRPGSSVETAQLFLLWPPTSPTPDSASRSRWTSRRSPSVCSCCKWASTLVWSPSISLESTLPVRSTWTWTPLNSRQWERTTTWPDDFGFIL